MKDNCWKEMHNHRSNDDLHPMGTWKVFEVSTSFPASCFRIISTGPDRNNAHYLCLSGFELYGKFRYEEEGH